MIVFFFFFFSVESFTSSHVVMIFLSGSSKSLLDEFLFNFDSR